MRKLIPKMPWLLLFCCKEVVLLARFVQGKKQKNAKDKPEKINSGEGLNKIKSHFV
jgi:hypothetical protein